MNELHPTGDYQQPKDAEIATSTGLSSYLKMWVGWLAPPHPGGVFLGGSPPGPLPEGEFPLWTPLYRFEIVSKLGKSACHRQLSQTLRFSQSLH